MRSALQLLGGVAVAGVVAAGSTAFTATGVTLGAGAATGFVGGTITQTVDGATILSTNYVVASGKVTGITIVFNDNNSDGKAVTVAPAGGVGFAGDSADHFACSVVNAGTDTSTCTVVQSGGAASTGGYTATGMTGLAITVA